MTKFSDMFVDVDDFSDIKLKNNGYFRYSLNQYPKINFEFSNTNWFVDVIYSPSDHDKSYSTRVELSSDQASKLYQILKGILKEFESTQTEKVKRMIKDYLKSCEE